jgi:hypothetical protein
MTSEELLGPMSGRALTRLQHPDFLEDAITGGLRQASPLRPLGCKGGAGEASRRQKLHNQGLDHLEPLHLRDVTAILDDLDP